ncbi:MAG: integrase [Candidatus Nitrosocaldaceae archaeon]|nr:MAG: integrase [Candidatus Nitrosocaldaceae archaeon]
MTILFSSTNESKELAKKYGYKEWMISRFMNYIPNVDEFLNSMENFRYKYIRLNSLKRDPKYIKDRLRNKGFELKDTVIDEVYQVNSIYPLGATTEYLLGYYYIQDLSSCIAVKALDPKPFEDNIDMCASPGGKSSYIAQLMNNQGLLVAIEANKDRLSALLSNLSRCGVSNATIFNMDATNASLLSLKFDKVMLDAPCSCEGVIPKDIERRYNREPKDIEYCSIIQKRLLDEAIKIVKDDGIIVYSTCSFAPEEDEAIIDYAIKRYNVKIEPLPYGSEGLSKFGDLVFDQQVRNARRFYPHIHNTLGFFIAKIRL